jgi:hypothetical protein
MPGDQLRTSQRFTPAAVLPMVQIAITVNGGKLDVGAWN